MKIKKCNVCGNIIITKNDKTLICCNEGMVDVIPNSVDASFEKHIPEYEIINNKINIKVNHVMQENHYIKWIMLCNNNQVFYKEFNINEIPEVTFEFIEDATIYSYCNLHGLWAKKVE